VAVATKGSDNHRGRDRIRLGNNDPLPIEGIRVARIARTVEQWGWDVGVLWSGRDSRPWHGEKDELREMYTAEPSIDTG